MTTTRHRRRHEPVLEVLPELMHYADTGCEVAVSCLQCPLPQCKYDDYGWYRRFKETQRDSEIEKARETLTVTQIAEQMALSRRTIHRALRRVH